MTAGITLPFRVGISPTLHIRGLIAVRKIRKGEVLERCPAVIYKSVPELIEKTVYDKYVFEWGTTHEAMALGYGALYNHSYEPNVMFECDMKNKTIVFTARCAIAAGEELTINYNSEDPEPIDPGYISFDRELEN